MLGLDKLTNALGLLYMFRGIASLLGTPSAGALYDLTHSYVSTFGVAGVLLILASIMTCCISLPKHRAPQNQNQKESHPSNESHA